MDRVMQHNVLAMSGKAVEAAGDVDTLLLDKTGTITLGNRQATEFLPAPGVTEHELADAAQLSSLADETPEGRQHRRARQREIRHPRPRDVTEHRRRVRPVHRADPHERRQHRWARRSAKAPPTPIEKFVNEHGGDIPPTCKRSSTKSPATGGTPLVVAEDERVLGVIQLKDIVKGGMKERFAQLRAMGIKTVMITGDNPLTAAAIAAEAGVDDFLAEATPEAQARLHPQRASRRTTRRHDR